MRRLNPFLADKSADKGRGTRRRPVGRQRRQLYRWAGIGAAAAAILCIPYALWSTGRIAGWSAALERSTLDLTAAGGLAVSDVAIFGRHEADLADIENALGIRQGDPIFGLDLAGSRRRLETVPWIKHASVSRQLPGRVVIRLAERTPLALWQREGKLSVVDEEGVVLALSVDPRFANLPVVVGADAPAHAPALLAALDGEPELKKRLSAAVRVGGRRWNLRFDDCIDVRLPETGIEDALARLAKLNAREQLLDRDLVAIDLRMSDRLVVQPTPGARKRQVQFGGRDT